MELRDKKVLVIGLARSGMAAIRLLHAAGAGSITLTERKDVAGKEELAQMGVRIVKQTPEVFTEDYDLVIKNPGISPLTDFVVDMRKRGIPVITEFELAFQLAQPQHYAAVTGTNGKTTTTTLVYEFLKKAYGDKAHVAGNIGIPLCEVVLEHDLMHQSGHYIALEMSQGQLIDIDAFRPEVSTILNLTPDHIDFMGSLDNYYTSKTRIYKNMTESGMFLKNIDDPVIAQYTDRYKVPCRVKTLSLQQEADACLKDGFVVIDGEKVMPVSEIRLPGDHNKQNILAAAGLCHELGVSAEDIADVVRHFKGVEHRIEFVRELDGVKYYNDSKGTNTDATITALKAFDHGVILLVGGFEKGLSMDEVKKHLGCVKQVIGFGASGKRIATDLAGDQAIVVTDLVEAVDEARKAAVRGDTVLLSPTTSSFDQYPNFEERGKHFKQIVNALQ